MTPSGSGQGMSRAGTTDSGVALRPSMGGQRRTRRVAKCLHLSGSWHALRLIPRIAAWGRHQPSSSPAMRLVTRASSRGKRHGRSVRPRPVTARTVLARGLRTDEPVDFAVCVGCDAPSPACGCGSMILPGWRLLRPRTSRWTAGARLGTPSVWGDVVRTLTRARSATKMRG
jgi:hypothetical protein